MGGYMGLLIGASVLSIFEVIDLFLYNFVVKLMNRRAAFTKVKDSGGLPNNCDIAKTQKVQTIEVKP